jgi:hypothetical protein
MPEQPVPAAESRRILALARDDRNAARRELARLGLDDQVALVCEAPLSARREILDLLPSPEAVIPRLPEAELTFTAKAIGLGDAAWILAHATPEQLVASVDLDAWSASDLAPDGERLGAWLAALAEAGEEPLLRGARALDPELLVLWLKHRVQVWLRPSDPGWEAPAGSLSLDGQFFFRSRREGDDLADVRLLLDALFREDYWAYFRLLQGVEWELESETEEWALRWREGRLMDLGFPSWEEAAALYAIVPERALDELPEAPPAAEVGAWRLPIWMPRLPISAASAHSLLRALAALGEAERRPYLFALLALANRVAVADRLPLGDAESIPLALEKVASLASRGLDHLAAAHGASASDVLRRASLERLFRVGFTLARAEAGRSHPPDDEGPRGARASRALAGDRKRT